VTDMTSRERVLASLDHREPDRVPVDLGGTENTSMHIKTYRRLRPRLGLPEVEPTYLDFVQQIALIDDDVVDRVGSDVRSASESELRWADIEGMTTRTDDGYLAFHDEWQIGWRMPVEGGWYFDMFEHPLSGTISVGDLDAYQWPDLFASSVLLDFGNLRKRIIDIAGREQRAVALSQIGVTAGGPLELYTWLRGFEDAYIDLVADQALAGRIIGRIADIKMAYWEKLLDAVGDVVDVVVESDDLGGQDQPLISPDTYRRVVKPHHKRLYDFLHQRTQAKVFFHSCGAIRSMIPDLIEVGVDILNPLQVSAAGMDSAGVKRDFGRDLVFWGGGVDTQRVLGSGSPRDVREEVRRRLGDLMPGGGFVFATVHNIQGNVPEENLIAMWETVREYGKY
jgi:uroporphyrinogen decarboxylase